MAANDTAAITVVSLDGSAVLGPEAMPKTMTISELRTRILCAPDPFVVGEEVEVRDNGDDEWETGIVTGLQPLEVKYGGAGRGREWDQVRKAAALGKSRDVTLFAGSRRLENHDTLEVVLRDSTAAQLTALFTAITEEQRLACKNAIHYLCYQAFERRGGYSEDEDDSDNDEDEEQAWLEEQMKEMFGGFSDVELADREVMLYAVTKLGRGALNFAAESLKTDSFFMEGVDIS
eukprot:CAMPEP_0204592130 /NCGR_PEP_ID=MMETSP0661-20131031/50762_1 /ASSEMBLY_ACC=CAM_ASM_000606 /TAXON_ID=109239 /ORGANISM="Alexandrium margalefi, Strain AMGDE01CS-322" /LENGTH=232 /DNA_ID=CAMNT_0051602317 /DNA_START=77 /DNA_END=775 /DNA_ORIENTATION=+